MALPLIFFLPASYDNVLALIDVDFKTVSCVAACMTMELAESGKQFITTIINGSDLVPSFSAASIDDLRSEVMKYFFFRPQATVQDLCIIIFRRTK